MCERNMAREMVVHFPPASPANPHTQTHSHASKYSIYSTTPASLCLIPNSRMRTAIIIVRNQKGTHGPAMPFVHSFSYAMPSMGVVVDFVTKQYPKPSSTLNNHKLIVFAGCAVNRVTCHSGILHIAIAHSLETVLKTSDTPNANHFDLFRNNHAHFFIENLVCAGGMSRNPFVFLRSKTLFFSLRILLLQSKWKWGLVSKQYLCKVIV